VAHARSVRLLLALIAACGPVRPTEGPPLAAVPEPSLPQLPALVGGCLGSEDDEVTSTEVWKAIERYDKAWIARGLARHGWTELGRPRSVAPIGSSPRPGFDLMSGELHLRKRGARLLEDEHGQRWLKTRLRYRCTSEQPRFVIDSNHGVFEVVFGPRCGETRKVQLCGTLAAGGCGIDPGPQDASAISEYWFVPVPRGAKWLGIEPVRIDDPIPTCFQAVPRMVTRPG
jgi:hypothetical protein